MSKTQKKKMGRPKLPPSEAKTVYLRVRVKPSQLAEIHRRAKSPKHRPEDTPPLKDTSAWVLMKLGIDGESK